MISNEAKLRFYENKLGSMSSSEAFELAIQAEQFAKDCGPCDIATPHFIQQKLAFEKYSLLLEAAGR